MKRFSAHLQGPDGVRHTVFEGQDTLVIPVVMIVEGVLNGSLLKQEHFGRYVEAWNGRPVPILHPERNGMPVSANQPDIIERNTVGRVFGARVSNGKLKAELWICVEKAKRLGHSQLLDDLEAGKIVEVSTGYFSDEQQVSGEFNGRPYDRIDVNIRPDHLALLPGQIGACSVADGCGTRVNQSKGIAMKTKEAFKQIAEALGFRANCSCDSGVTTMDLKKKAETLKANGKITPEQFEMLVGMDPEQLSMIGAIAGALGEATVGEEPIEMEDQLPGEEEEMPMDMQTHKKKPVGAATGGIQVNAEELESLISKRVEAALVANRSSLLVEELVGNEACEFTADELKAMSEATLLKIKSALRPTDYSLQAGAPMHVNSGAVKPVANPLTVHSGGLVDRIQKKEA